MNYIDIIFIIVIIYFTILGLRKGLIRSIGGILSIIVGFYVASMFYLRFSIWIQGLSTSLTETIASIVAFVLIFIVVNRLFMVIVYVLDKVFSLPIVGIFNKLFGALFGFLTGSLIIGIIVLIFSSFSSSDVVAFENSKVVPKANKVIEVIKPIIPKSIDMSFLDNAGLNNADEIIDNLPSTGSISVDELINYLSERGDFSKDAINKLKETEFKDRANISVEEIKSKFQEYLDKLK